MTLLKIMVVTYHKYNIHQSGQNTNLQLTWGLLYP